MREPTDAPVVLAGTAVSFVEPDVARPDVAHPDARLSLDATPGAGGARLPLLAGLARTARPRQWVKNLLVFAAPGAAGALPGGTVLARSLLAFVVFCLAASGVYFVNDASDADFDRRHPSKRYRPVAAGVVPMHVAYGVGAALLAAAVLVGLGTLGWRFSVVVAAYAGVNLAYNARLRFEAVLDLAAVASGFVLRAVAGGFATNVRLSEWFLVVLSAASLFVVAGKRQVAARVEYPVAYLRFVRLLGAGVALTAYGLWAFEKSARLSGSNAVLGFGGVLFELTIVPFALAILRYALLVEKGAGESPEDLLLGDTTLLCLMGVWGLLFALGVYGA